MTKEIVKKQGFEVQGKSKTLHISTQELVSHGCKSCIWRLHEQCPHSIEEGKVYEEGYCMEYVKFLFGFAEGTDSTSAMWEKFSLYVSRMQSSEDYKEYIKLLNKVKKIREEGVPYKERQDLEIQLEQLRVYWVQLNEMLIKGYGRIADRESKSRDASVSGHGIHNAKVINFNMIEKKE